MINKGPEIKEPNTINKNKRKDKLYSILYTEMSIF